MRARKGLLAASSLWISCFLAGCGGKGIPSGMSSKGPLLLWHWMTNRDDALQQLAERYRQQTGMKVVVELYAPSDAYSSKVRAAAQTNTLPDIFGVLGESPRDLASYINAGHVANLAPAMAANHRTWQVEFFPKALATVSFNPGNQYHVAPGIYGVPIDVTNIEMLYNKALFKKAGLDPERPPQTWNEFLSDWHRLKAAGIPGLVSGWGEIWMIDCFASNYAFHLMGEEKVLDTFRGKVSYTDPDWTRVLELFETIRKEDLLVSGAVTMINKTAEQTFANDKAAFAFNGSWSVDVYKGMNPDLAYGVMLPPRLTDKHPMSIWGGAGSSLMVNARSRQKEAATQFLQWLTAPEQQAVLTVETLNLPANRRCVTQLPQILAAFASRMDLTTHPTQWPLTEDPTVTEAFDKGIQSILIGEKTPARVAADVQQLKQRLRP